MRWPDPASPTSVVGGDRDSDDDDDGGGWWLVVLVSMITYRPRLTPQTWPTQPAGQVESSIARSQQLFPDACAKGPDAWCCSLTGFGGVYMRCVAWQWHGMAGMDGWMGTEMCGMSTWMGMDADGGHPVTHSETKGTFCARESGRDDVSPPPAAPAPRTGRWTRQQREAWRHTDRKQEEY